MTQIITLPSGRKVTGTTYVHAWKTLRAMTPEQRAWYRSDAWNWHSNTGEDILREIRAGVHDRINIRGARQAQKEKR